MPKLTPATQRKDVFYALRVSFGFIWLVDSLLKWNLLLNGFSYPDFISSMAGGQPPLIASWITSWANVIALTPDFALILAIVETYIAISLLFGFKLYYTFVFGIVLDVLIWSTGEGFGSIFTGAGTDIGPSPLYILVFVVLLANKAREDHSGPNLLNRNRDTEVEREIETRKES